MSLQSVTLCCMPLCSERQYANCRYAERHYAECCHVENRYALSRSFYWYPESHYAQHHYAECRGAFKQLG
jgi:hypothetical protein